MSDILSNVNKYLLAFESLTLYCSFTLLTTPDHIFFLSSMIELPIVRLQVNASSFVIISLVLIFFNYFYFLDHLLTTIKDHEKNKTSSIPGGLLRPVLSKPEDRHMSEKVLFFFRKTWSSIQMWYFVPIISLFFCTVYIKNRDLWGQCFLLILAILVTFLSFSLRTRFYKSRSITKKNPKILHIVAYGAIWVIAICVFLYGFFVISGYNFKNYSKCNLAYLKIMNHNFRNDKSDNELYFTIKDKDFSGIELVSNSFESFYFEEVSFQNSVIDHCIFKNCVFKNVSFSTSLLSDINFDSCSFQGVSFEGATCRADFYRSTLDSVNFDSTVLNRSNFLDSHISAFSCKDANFRNVDLRTATFSDPIMADWYRSVDYRNTICEGRKFRYAQLPEKIIYLILTYCPEKYERDTYKFK